MRDLSHGIRGGTGASCAGSGGAWRHRLQPGPRYLVHHFIEEPGYSPPVALVPPV